MPSILRSFLLFVFCLGVFVWPVGEAVGADAPVGPAEPLPVSPDTPGLSTGARQAVERYVSSAQKAEQDYRKRLELAKQFLLRQLQAEANKARLKGDSKTSSAIASVIGLVEGRPEAQTAALPGAAGPTPLKTPKRLAAGLLVIEYPKHRDQIADGKKFIAEPELGPPVEVRVVGLSEKGGWRATEYARTAFAKGYIRIDKAGEYAFRTYGNYTGGTTLTIGNRIIRQGDKTEFFKLERGVYPFESVFRIGNHSVELKWYPPGGRELVSIPSAVLYHDPVLAAKAKRAVRP